MITARYSYSCDACGKGILGDDVWQARVGERVPPPRGLHVVGSRFVCVGCLAVAEHALEGCGKAAEPAGRVQ